MRRQAPTVLSLNRGHVLQANNLDAHRVLIHPITYLIPKTVSFFLSEHAILALHVFNFTSDEDCLVLSIWALSSIIDLPVMV